MTRGHQNFLCRVRVISASHPTVEGQSDSHIGVVGPPLEFTDPVEPGPLRTRARTGLAQANPLALHGDPDVSQLAGSRERGEPLDARRLPVVDTRRGDRGRR